MNGELTPQQVTQLKRHRAQVNGLLRTCRACGCDDEEACEGGCSWLLLDLDTPSGICSRCAELVGYNVRALIALGTPGGPTLRELLPGPYGRMVADAR
jgi:hypothetical protein